TRLTSFPTRRSSDLIVNMSEGIIVVSQHCPDICLHGIGHKSKITSLLTISVYKHVGTIKNTAYEKWYYRRIWPIGVLARPENIRSEEHTSELQSREN